MNDDRRLARVLSDPSRRTFFGLTGAAMALAFTTNLADPWTARASTRDGYPFQLGVASGDPLPDSVILWTRLAGGRSNPGRHAVRTDQGRLGDRRGSGVRPAGQARPRVATPESATRSTWTCAACEPGREYFYRFRAAARSARSAGPRPHPGAGASPEHAVGLRLLPASWEDGYYTAYRHMAERGPRRGVPPRRLHLRVRHRPRRRAGTPRCPTSLRQQTAPWTSTASGTRCTRRDPDLQAAHRCRAVDRDARRPRGGQQLGRRPRPSGNATPEDSSSAGRTPSGPTGRTCRCGRAACRAALTMRIYRRFAVRRPRRVQRARHPAVPQRPGVRRRPAGDCADALDPARTMLGAEQEKWLLDGLGDSRARWNVLAQQIAMCQLDYDPRPPRSSAWTCGTATRPPRTE